jgi:hypothetical protein
METIDGGASMRFVVYPYRWSELPYVPSIWRGEPVLPAEILKKHGIAWKQETEPAWLSIDIDGAKLIELMKDGNFDIMIGHGTSRGCPMLAFDVVGRRFSRK